MIVFEYGNMPPYEDMVVYNDKRKWEGAKKFFSVCDQKKILPLEPYQGNKIKIRVRCLVDQYEWLVAPSNISNDGRGCSFCANNSSEKANQKILEICKSLNIIPLTTYKSTRIKIKLRCLIDGHEWDMLPYSIFNGKGCPFCYRQASSESKFIDCCNSKHIIPLESYKNSKTKIKVRCLVDDHEWCVRPSSIIMGSGCPVCAESCFNPDRCGYVYLYRWTRNDHSFLKYGITHNIDQRRKIQSIKTEYEPDLLYARFFLMNGQACIDKEKEIKTAVGERYITKNIMPDGYTETCPDTQENIDTIIGIIDE